MNIIKSAVDIDNKKIVYDGCMVTYNGVIVNLFEPDPNDILLTDIAHGLAFTCRWNGHTKTYFSVAEHCCMMHDLVPDDLKLTALFHDCEEAYWGDIIKPLKNLLPLEIRNKMESFRAMIFEKFGVKEICKEVDKCDFQMLQWDLDNLILPPITHVGMTCYNAEIEWLKRATNLLPKEQDRYSSRKLLKPEVFRYLLSIGIDLFDLIESGLAINKTTLP